MLILPHVKIYLGKFQLNFQLHMKERRFVFEYDFGFKYIYIFLMIFSTGVQKYIKGKYVDLT